MYFIDMAICWISGRGRLALLQNLILTQILNPQSPSCDQELIGCSHIRGLNRVISNKLIKVNSFKKGECDQVFYSLD